MKNSNQSLIGSSIRRSVSILLMFATLAVTNVAMAADFKNRPSDNGTSIGVTKLSNWSSAFDNSQPRSRAASLDGNPRLIAEQWALYCYTDFGAFPMVDAVPPGSPCTVPLRFFPFIAYGTAW
jgi:hypothetical protein